MIERISAVKSFLRDLYSANKTSVNVKSELSDYTRSILDENRKLINSYINKNINQEI